jgi:hypothetical protein
VPGSGASKVVDLTALLAQSLAERKHGAAVPAAKKPATKRPARKRA